MSLFDRFADWVADRWSSAPWFIFCLGFILVWLGFGAAKGLWSNDVWHLTLNSPTTALTFLGVFLLHNTQHRKEKADIQRWETLFEHLGIDDPVEDEGQKAHDPPH